MKFMPMGRSGGRSSAISAARCGTAILLLIGLVPAAQAANECGPPPPGGGTVTCPAGTYPGGIDYTIETRDDLEILLSPGVRAESTSSLRLAGGDLRLIGPADTVVASSRDDRGPVLASTSGSVFMDLDQVRSLSGLPIEVRAGDVTIAANRIVSPFLLVTAYARRDLTVRVGEAMVSGNIGFASNPFSLSAGDTLRAEISQITSYASFGAVVRADGDDVSIKVGSIHLHGKWMGGIVARGGTLAVELGTLTRTWSGTGIVAEGSGNVSVVAGSIQSGSVDLLRQREPGAPVITAQSTGGDVTVTAGSVGAGFQTAILATSGTGNVLVTSGGIGTSLDRSSGIVARSDSGSVRVVSGSISHPAVCSRVFRRAGEPSRWRAAASTCGARRLAFWSRRRPGRPSSATPSGRAAAVRRESAPVPPRGRWR